MLDLQRRIQMRTSADLSAPSARLEQAAGAPTKPTAESEQHTERAREREESTVIVPLLAAKKPLRKKQQRRGTASQEPPPSQRKSNPLLATP